MQMERSLVFAGTVSAIVGLGLLAASVPCLGQAAYPSFTNLVILDPADKNVTTEDLMAGQTYTATFKVSISKKDPRDLILATSLDRVGDSYWTLGNYDEVESNIVEYNPSTSSVRFRFSEKEGVLLLALKGRIAEDLCQRPGYEGEILHSAREFSVLSLTAVDAQGNSVVLDDVKRTVKDAEIVEVEDLLEDKRKVVESGTDEFKEFYTGVLTYAEQSLYARGHTAMAKDLLSKLPDEAIVLPSMALYTAAIVGLLVLLIIVGVMAYLGRQRVQLVSGRTERAANDLEAVLPRVERLDRSLAADLDRLMHDLKEVSKE